MSAPHVEFKVPKKVNDQILEALELASDTGKVKKGANETTKAIERGQAELVIIAEDVNPPEIVMHLPMLCKEKAISYLYVKKKAELGRAAGIPVAASSGAISDSGEAHDLVSELKEKAAELIKKKRRKKGKS